MQRTDMATLNRTELGVVMRKALWLSAWTIHNANHLRDKADGVKVGGHQASCASMVTLMAVLYGAVLRPQDRVAVKPHAGPVFHALQYMAGRLPLDKLALIAPHYPKAGPKGGRPPMPLETMLRVYFLQNWYALSDPMAEETLYDSEAMRRFAGIDLGDDRIPDETTILNFRHLLERHGLTEAIFADVNAHLADKGITLRSGTLVDATIIDAPSSTKNKAKARDPEMSSTKKGNDWYFGMKAHIGVDLDSGVTHSLETSTARVHDSQVWDALLHGEETSVWADKGYVSAEREAAFEGPGKVWGVMRKAPKGGELHPVDARINRLIAMVRAKVEHPFRVIKRQFGLVKTRYRGLAKNRAQLFTLFALGNLFLVRRKLMA